MQNCNKKNNIVGMATLLHQKNNCMKTLIVNNNAVSVVSSSNNNNNGTNATTSTSNMISTSNGTGNGILISGSYLVSGNVGTQQHQFQPQQQTFSNGTIYQQQNNTVTSPIVSLNQYHHNNQGIITTTSSSRMLLPHEMIHNSSVPRTIIGNTTAVNNMNSSNGNQHILVHPHVNHLPHQQQQQISGSINPTTSSGLNTGQISSSSTVTTSLPAQLDSYNHFNNVSNNNNQNNIHQSNNNNSHNHMNSQYSTITTESTNPSSTRYFSQFSNNNNSNSNIINNCNNNRNLITGISNLNNSQNNNHHLHPHQQHLLNSNNTISSSVALNNIINSTITPTTATATTGSTYKMQHHHQTQQNLPPTTHNNMSLQTNNATLIHNHFNNNMLVNNISNNKPKVNGENNPSSLIQTTTTNLSSMYDNMTAINNSKLNIKNNENGAVSDRTGLENHNNDNKNNLNSLIQNNDIVATQQNDGEVKIIDGVTTAGGDEINSEEPEPEIDIVINNVVCSFSVRCHLNLRDIALNGFNVEFRRENGMVTMKLRRPYTTASIWSSGRITCTGATSEDQAKIAARRYARCLQKLGFNVKFHNFRVVNVLGTCCMPWAIKIVNFSEKYKKDASYEPELHPGVTYKLKYPKATLKIFSTGSITVTAASVAHVQTAIEHIFPLVYEFRKKRTPQDLELLRSKQEAAMARQQQVYGTFTVEEEGEPDEDDCNDEDDSEIKNRVGSSGVNNKCNKKRRGKKRKFPAYMSGDVQEEEDDDANNCHQSNKKHSITDGRSEVDNDCDDIIISDEEGLHENFNFPEDIIEEDDDY